MPMRSARVARPECHFHKRNFCVFAVELLGNVTLRDHSHRAMSFVVDSRHYGSAHAHPNHNGKQISLHIRYLAVLDWDIGERPPTGRAEFVVLVLRYGKIDSSHATGGKSIEFTAWHSQFLQ